jgi:hypothetical protein
MRYLALVLCVLLSGCMPPTPTMATSTTLAGEVYVAEYFSVSANYFDRYVRVDSVSTRESEHGTLLWIEYHVVVDWARVDAVDSVLIKAVNSTGYLTREEIYSTPVHLGGFTGRKYLSNSLGNPKRLREVVRIISRSDVTPKLKDCYHTLSLDDGVVVLNRDGRFVVRARATINEKNNHCKTATLDLESGELTDCRDTECWVT